MYTLTPQEKYLRTKCGLPPVRAVTTPDPDDPGRRQLTTAQAAAAAHVDDAVIRQWAARKRILPVGGTEAHPLYLELDVLRVEAQTRRAPRARRLAEEAAQSEAGSPNSSRA